MKMSHWCLEIFLQVTTCYQGCHTSHFYNHHYGKYLKCFLSSTFNLPSRSPIWKPLIDCAASLDSSDLGCAELADRQLHVITSPLCMSKFKTCPVNKKNKVEWTAQQREWTLKTTPITNLPDVQLQVRQIVSCSLLLY